MELVRGKRGEVGGDMRLAYLTSEHQCPIAQEAVVACPELVTLMHGIEAFRYKGSRKEGVGGESVP